MEAYNNPHISLKAFLYIHKFVFFKGLNNSLIHKRHTQTYTHSNTLPRLYNEYVFTHSLLNKVHSLSLFFVRFVFASASKYLPTELPLRYGIHTADPQPEYGIAKGVVIIPHKSSIQHIYSFLVVVYIYYIQLIEVFAEP